MQKQNNHRKRKHSLFKYTNKTSSSERSGNGEDLSNESVNSPRGRENALV